MKSTPIPSHYTGWFIGVTWACIIVSDIPITFQSQKKPCGNQSTAGGALGRLLSW